MTGGTYKRRRRKPNQFKHKTTSPTHSASSPVTDSGDVLTFKDSDHNSDEPASKRCRRKIKHIQEPCLASTPVQANATSPTSEEKHQISKTESESNESKPYRRGSLNPRQIIKKQKKGCNSNCNKKRGGKRQKTNDAILTQQSAEQTQRCRPRLNLEKSSAEEQDTLPSSDLSIELSIHEEPLSLLSFEESEDNDQEEEDEELPSFLMVDSKSSSIAKGGFVWCKFRNFPFWPAMVKSVNHKLKRASIMMIDDQLIQQKNGIHVALKTLKPYECEESSDLICKAKEKFDVHIQRSIELIEDYIIRKGNGSFSGSFVEYYSHDMSYPVRRKYPATSESLTIANDVMEESLPVDELMDDSFSEPEGDMMTSKRLLPDRTHAAHNRANEKLVHFIVKQHMVDQHLLAVMQGQRQSRWLRSFLSAKRRRVVNIYLEDDEQLDQVYWYLSELYTTAAETDTCLQDLKSIDLVPFVLDVLLPEATIYAIAGVENISIKKAEEKYLNGRSLSKRERQEFDLMIEKQMKRKSFPSALAVFSETFK